MFDPKFVGYAAWAVRVAEFGPIRKARLQRGFRKRGAALVEKIKAATPVDSGSLRASVRMVDARKKPGVVIIAGGTAETARGPHLDEALLTEYGTRKEAAEPFFFPTINADRGAIKRAIASDVTSDDET